MKLKVIHTPIYNINLLALSQRGKVSNHLTRTFMFTEESKYQTLLPKDSYRIITSWFGGTSLPKKIVKIYGL